MAINNPSQTDSPLPPPLTASRHIRQAAHAHKTTSTSKAKGGATHRAPKKASTRKHLLSRHTAIVSLLVQEPDGVTVEERTSITTRTYTQNGQQFTVVTSKPLKNKVHAATGSSKAKASKGVHAKGTTATGGKVHTGSTSRASKPTKATKTTTHKKSSGSPAKAHTSKSTKAPKIHKTAGTHRHISQGSPSTTPSPDDPILVGGSPNPYSWSDTNQPGPAQASLRSGQYSSTGAYYAANPPPDPAALPDSAELVTNPNTGVISIELAPTGSRKRSTGKTGLSKTGSSALTGGTAAHPIASPGPSTTSSFAPPKPQQLAAPLAAHMHLHLGDHTPHTRNELNPHATRHVPPPVHQRGSGHPQLNLRASTGVSHVLHGPHQHTPPPHLAAHGYPASHSGGPLGDSPHRQHHLSTRAHSAARAQPQHARHLASTHPANRHP